MCDNLCVALNSCYNILKVRRTIYVYPVTFIVLFVHIFNNKHVSIIYVQIVIVLYTMSNVCLNINVEHP